MYSAVSTRRHGFRFYRKQCQKRITYDKSIIKPLTRLFDIMQDSNQVPLDLVVDAGVSNIAQWVSYFEGNAPADADLYPFMNKNEQPIDFRITGVP